MKICNAKLGRALASFVVIALASLLVQIHPADSLPVDDYVEGHDYEYQHIQCEDGSTLKSWNLADGAEGLGYYINEDMIAAGWEPHIIDAFEMWQGTNAAVSFEYLGSTTATNELRWNGDRTSAPSAPRDGLSVISFASNMPIDGVGGLTVGCPGSPLPHEMNISISDEFELAPISQIAELQAERVMLHEIGHALGLGHPENPKAPTVMHLSAQLSPIDRVAVQQLYPKQCTGTTPFGDVLGGQYYTEAVAWAYCTGVTTGTAAATFSPTAAVTRAQLATFLWRVALEPFWYNNPFADVPPSSYYANAVAWMATEGITTGTTATTFSPHATVTRAQLATFLWRYHGEPTGHTHPFSDVGSPSYYEHAVAWMASTGITTGTTATTFSPHDPVTRAQAITFLSRYVRYATN